MLDKIVSKTGDLTAEKVTINGVVVPKHNFTAIIPPTVTDDSSQGYSKGSNWVDTVAKRAYICADSSLGAAFWTMSSQGHTGIQGNTGLMGPVGQTGPLGQTGIQGIQGNTGPLGQTGIQGIQGNTGPLGQTGIQGIQGNTGPLGQTGLMGPEGQTGPLGQTGIQGNTGPLGQTGIQGNTGPLGQTGLMGPQGVTGIAGVTGIMGVDGVTGIMGIDGVTGVMGLTGLQGIVGNTGPLGQTGISGQTGVVGPAGQTGVQGIQGVTGLLTDLVYANFQTNDYTLQLSDRNKLVGLTGINARTFTIPPSSTANFDLGTNIAFLQDGTGQLSVAAGAGVTVKTEVGLKLNAQYATAAAIKIGTEIWVLAGSLKS